MQNNGRQFTTLITKYSVTRTPLKIGGEFRFSGSYIIHVAVSFIGGENWIIQYNININIDMFKIFLTNGAILFIPLTYYWQ